MKKFVVGIIFFAIAMVACVFTTYILVDALRIQGENSAEGIALIVTLPLAFISFAVQIITGMISGGFLFSCFKIKILLVPSIIFILLICASWTVDIIYFIQLLI